MSFGWLKQYVPRGIYGRAALILLLPIVALQLAMAFVFAQRHFEGVTNQMTDTVLRELALVLDAVEAAPDADAIPEWVWSRAGPLMISAKPMPPGALEGEDQRRWYDYSGSVMTPRLHRFLPGLHRVDLSDGKLVQLYIDTSKQPVRLTFDRRRMSPANPHQFFVYTVIFGIITALISIVYLRNQLRPIRRLGRVAEAFGRGRHVPYTPAGAVEVRLAGSAFIDMRQRIERQIEQRTLMLSGVSHDLRTPLTRMRLGLSMLDGEEVAPLLQDVDEMQRMLDEFLNFAKGASEGEPEKVEPHAFIGELVQEAKRAGSDVTLLPPEGEGTGHVRLRKLAIGRAVDNLISNAVRYGDQAQVSVLLTDKTLRIRVEDDGPGIPEEQRSAAMRPFSRLDPARNQDKGGGVGLGLAIAADVARAHGGMLRLDASETLGGLCADIVLAR